MYSNIRTATKELLDRLTPMELARHLDINHGHVYQARDGRYSPTYRRALQDMDYLPVPPKRHRAAVDVPPDFSEEQRELFRLAMRAYAPVLAGQIERMSNGTI